MWSGPDPRLSRIADSLLCVVLVQRREVYCPEVSLAVRMGMIFREREHREVSSTSRATVGTQLAPEIYY